MKNGIATFSGCVSSQAAMRIGMAEIQTISGGLTSTTSTYNSRPAIQRRATYSSHATSSFKGERSTVNRMMPSVSNSKAVVAADTARRLSEIATCERTLRPAADFGRKLDGRDIDPRAAGTSSVFFIFWPAACRCQVYPFETRHETAASRIRERGIDNMKPQCMLMFFQIVSHAFGTLASSFQRTMPTAVFPERGDSGAHD